MRITHLLAIVAIFSLVAGCTAPGGGKVSRDQLSFPVASKVGGVNATSAGDVPITGANGILVTGDNGTVRIGLGPVVQTQGAFVACGLNITGCNLSDARPGFIVASGSLISANDLALNAAGPDGDGVIYFYDDGRQNGQYMRWYNAASRFQVSNDTEIRGEVLAHGPVGTVTAAPTSGGSFVFTPALEGNEMAIYLRGSAALVNGTATIAFPEAFAVLVGDGAITAQVTLTSKAPGLWISEKDSRHITVETLTPDVGTKTFDYFVQAPRIGGQAFHTIR